MCKRKIFLLLLIIYVAFCPLKLMAGDASIELSVDKTEVNLNDTIIVILTLKGGADILMEDELDLSSLSQFNIISNYRSSSTNLSVTSGDVETVNTIQYILQPVKPGNFIIGPFELKSGGKFVKSQSIAIKVKDEKGSGNTNSTVPNYSSQNLDDDYNISSGSEMKVKQEIDKDSVYVNEQATLTFKFYYNENLYGSSTYRPPDTTGFNAVSLSQSSSPKVEKIDGVEYYVEEIKTALFPISSGNYTIGPTVLTVPIDFMDNRSISSNKVNVTVKPLPQEGKPADFSGAVGEFIIYSKVDKEKVDLNQPVTLEITVEGWGNVDNIGQPKMPDIPGFKVYPSGTKKENTVQNDLVYSKKIFKYILMPSRGGNLQVPELSYSYFNPSQGKYNTIKSKPLSISVQSSGLSPTGDDNKEQKDIKITGRDINYIKMSLNSDKSGSNLLYKNNLLRIFLIFPPVALAFSYFYKKHLDRLCSDIGFARFKRASGKARTSLVKARKLAKDNNEKEFYSLISRILNEYTGDKFNLPSAGLTLDKIVEIMDEKTVEDDVKNLFRSCYETCEYARFAPGEGDNKKMTEVIDMVEKLLNSLEKKLI